MISLYRFGHVLALLQTCYSQCFEPFDPKTLIVSNYENSSFPGFNLLRNTDNAMCMMICFKFKLCGSVDWIPEEKICRLNTRFVTKNNSSLMTTGQTFHVERKHFPVHLAGNCLNNICTDDAICISGKCLPVLKAPYIRENIYKDCSDIMKRDPSKEGQDGVYVIYSDTRREVFCDMTTDGGGWTVIQKRLDGDVDFYRTWIEYKHGFGNATKNYWIGNDAIHTLTRDKNQELRVDVERYNGQHAYAVYTTFYIGDEDNKYTVTVSGYNGTAGDGFVHNGMKFSTHDQDNDLESRNCAQMFKGAWWYKDCFRSNLNGRYAKSAVIGGQYMVWKILADDEALRKSVIMVRQRN